MKHLAVAHTYAQFTMFKAWGLIPPDTKPVRTAVALRGVRNAKLHLLPDWYRGLRMSDCADIDYMIKEGFFEVRYHEEPNVEQREQPVEVEQTWDDLL